MPVREVAPTAGSSNAPTRHADLPRLSLERCLSPSRLGSCPNGVPNAGFESMEGFSRSLHELHDASRRDFDDLARP